MYTRDIAKTNHFSTCSQAEFRRYLSINWKSCRILQVTPCAKGSHWLQLYRPSAMAGVVGNSFTQLAHWLGQVNYQDQQT